VMSRAVNDTDLIEQLISHAIPDVSANLLLLIGVVTILARLNWRLALLSLVPTPLIAAGLRASRSTFVLPFDNVRSTWANSTLRSMTIFGYP